MAGIPVFEVVVSTQPGGGPQHVLALARGLRAHDWQPIVAGPAGGALVKRFASTGAECLAMATDRLWPITPLALAREIRRRGVRLVHSHGKGAGLHGRLAARLAGVPAIHPIHGLHYERYPRPVAAAYLALERRLSRYTAVVINVSHAQEAEGVSLRLFTRAQSRVIVNGVDSAALAARALDREAARTALGLPQAARVVGAVARFDEVKRLDIVLRAVGKLDDAGVMAVLVGGGPEEPSLRSLAADLRLGPRVVFPGEIPDAARLFRAFDIFAAPSRKEGMPLAVLEAMAIGLPIVASDIEAHREVLDPATGVLVEGSGPAFAGALRAILGDPERARALADANRARARSRFDEETMVAAVDGVYRGVLGL
jgi:glycosyltransferase involved in cell wall biosynthesis